jgi:hypothetical protein
MPRFWDGLKRLLAGEPWTERRKKERRGRTNRGESLAPGAGRDDNGRGGERRRGDRRGLGWLRFWNPP